MSEALAQAAIFTVNFYGSKLFSRNLRKILASAVSSPETLASRMHFR
jgi:hypothetical protein